MAITLGKISLLPLSLQADPGMVAVRLLACQQEWETADLDGKRFTLRAGHLDFHPLPIRTRLEPFVPIEFRLDFPVQALNDPLLLRCSRGLLMRHESLDLLRQPLSDLEERRQLDNLCYSAWFERGVTLDLAYEPRKLRSGEASLDEAARLLERYLHVRPDDPEALKTLERVRLKKELARALHAGDWLRVHAINGKLRELQPGWRGPDVDELSPLEAAHGALKSGWLEVAEERLAHSIAIGESEAQAALLLARMASAWKRDLLRAGDWYVRYFELGGINEGVAHEAIEVLGGLAQSGIELRARLLAQLTERLVVRPDDTELADLIYKLAETQADAGCDVGEDFALLWVSYEKAFEHQVAVDRRVERTLLNRLETLHRRLGNDSDWLRIRRALADFEPGHPEYREQLAKLLEEKGAFEEAFFAQMSLWLTAPEDLKRSVAVGEAAHKAGLAAVEQRALEWAALLEGHAAAYRAGFGPAERVAQRMLFHPDLRPLAPLMLRWVEEDTSPDLTLLSIEMLEQIPGTLSSERWRELESAARNLPLVPSLEAALMVRFHKGIGLMHPLAVAARLSLDRILVARAETFAQGIRALGLAVEGRPLFEVEIRDAAERRLALHRIRELGKFFLGRLWDAGAKHAEPVEPDPIRDLLEAVYLHGIPDWSTRALLTDVARARKIPRHRWLMYQNEAKAYLRLAADPSLEGTEL